MHPAAAHSCHQKHPSKQHGGASARYPNAPHCHGQKQGGETRAKHETSPRKHPHYPIPNILKSSGPIYPLRSPITASSPFVTHGSVLSKLLQKQLPGAPCSRAPSRAGPAHCSQQTSIKIPADCHSSSGSGPRVGEATTRLREAGAVSPAPPAGAPHLREMPGKPVASLPYLPRRHTARGPASPQGPGKRHPPIQVLQPSIFLVAPQHGQGRTVCVRGTAGGQACEHLPSAQALPLFELEVGT